MHGGAQHISLDLEHVDFISSAGLRILLIWLKQLKAISGSFTVVKPSPQVLGILDMSGLTELLIHVPAESDKAQLILEGVFAGDRGRFHTFGLEEIRPGMLDVYQAVPDPAPDEDVYPFVRYPSSRLGIGIGAFGDSGSGSEGRFGEYLSACGVTVCLPTDGRNHPDYMMEDGVFVPTLSVYAGLGADARFSHSIMFEAANESHGIPLTQLASLVLQESASPAAMVLIIAETSFLVGAALRTSPVEVADPYSFPDVRKHFSFTVEPTSEHTTSIIVGVVSEIPSSVFRPLGAAPSCYGHVHAVPFSHRLLPVGGFEPQSFIHKLFDEDRVQTVFHLLHDDRHSSTSIESEFMRGIIWVHPLAGGDGGAV